MASENTDNEIKYPNAKMALEEMHIAYQVENERKRTLDGKANAFMAAFKKLDRAMDDCIEKGILKVYHFREYNTEA